MGMRHFEGYLPEGVALDWTVGTDSGNPTSDVIYGFTSVDQVQGEQYAIATLRYYEEGDQKRVTCIGPLAVSDYRASREAGELVLDPDSPNPTDTDIRALWTGSLDVPRRHTSEEMIGRLLRALFRKP